MKFSDIETTWKNLGTLAYHRRLTAYLTRMNSGIDRGDEHTVELPDWFIEAKGL